MIPLFHRKTYNIYSSMNRSSKILSLVPQDSYIIYQEIAEKMGLSRKTWYIVDMLIGALIIVAIPFFTKPKLDAELKSK